jgi:hypothetical protein
MAALTNPALLALFREALREWRYDGFVTWKRVAAEWLTKNLEGCTQKAIAKLMYEHVESGGEIDQVRERRPEFQRPYEFHFDFRLQVESRRIYIETTLDTTRTGPTITVVSIHDA